MYFLYSILLGIGVLALLPRFLLDAARHGKYAAGLGERAGSLPPFDSGGRPVVWLHCVSVGEAQAARPLARALNPSVVLVMETELWPRFFRECRRRGVSVALVNGRISEKSFGRYRLIRPFIRRVLADLSLAAVQTQSDAARLSALGLAPGRLRVTGNVKFDIEEAAALPPTEELRRRFRVSGDRPLVVAASTHAPEERVVLEAFGALNSAARRPRLL